MTKDRNVLKEQTTQFFFKFCIILFAPGKKKTYIFNPSGIDLEEMLTKNRLSDATKYPQLSPFKDTVLYFRPKRRIRTSEYTYRNSDFFQKLKQDFLTQILMFTAK